MIIPLKDDNPTSIFPYVTISIIAANILVFVYQLSLGPELKLFIFKMGLIPKEITHFVDLDPISGYPVALNFITSLFMHGGIVHLIGNIWFLWIFGDNIEDDLGHFKFLLFYMLCGFIATLTHIFFNFNSTIPCIGASGAIAGVLGAYILLYPGAKVYTFIFFIIFIRVVPIPAILVIGFWIFVQVLHGIQTVGTPQLTGVAWFAHIGGFGAGVAFIYLFGKRKVRRRKKYFHSFF